MKKPLIMAAGFWLAAICTVQAQSQWTVPSISNTGRAAYAKQSNQTVEEQKHSLQKYQLRMPFQRWKTPNQPGANVISPYANYKQPIVTTKSTRNSDDPVLWANVIYSSSWNSLPNSASYKYGIYTFDLTNATVIDTLSISSEWNANGGGVFKDGKFHFINDTYVNDYDVTYYYRVNTNTWETEYYNYVEDLGLMATDLDVDPVSGKVYGCFFGYNSNGENDHMEFATIDYATQTKTVIANLDKVFWTIAVNGQGEVYGIAGDGNLYRFDKETGEQTLVGPTGLKPQYQQSATFDKRTGKMYWAATFPTTSNLKSGLYEVSTESGHATRIADFPNDEELIAIQVRYPDAKHDAPAEPSNLTTAFETDQLTGTVSFTMPQKQFGGDPLSLTESLKYTILANGEALATGTALPGESVSREVTVSKGGNTKIAVTAENTAGSSPEASKVLWLGPDAPVAPKTVTATYNETNRQVSLHWSQPKAGINNGYIDPSLITYDVWRMPDSVKVGESVSDTTFTEVLEEKPFAYYTYRIIPFYKGQEGRATVSNGFTAGTAFVPPYFEEFDTPDTWNLFTVIDANNDGSTWQRYDNFFHETYAYAQANRWNEGDDWLITPPIHMKSGYLYPFSFMYRYRMIFGNERLEVKYGKGTDPSKYETLMPRTDVTSGYFTTFEKYVSTTEDGDYRFAFHYISDRDKYGLYIDSIKVGAGLAFATPDSVQQLQVKGGYRGALNATATMISPKVDISGNNLTAISLIRLERDGIAVDSVRNPALGTPLTLKDNDPTNGYHNYTIRVFNNHGEGMPASRRIFIGQDVPGDPTDITLTDETDHLHLKWKSPGDVGANGGFVEGNHLKFKVFNIDENGTAFGEALTETTNTEYDITGKSTTGEQKLYYYGVTTVGDVGSSRIRTSNPVVLGDDYTIPFKESFSNGAYSHLWWQSRYGGIGGYLTASNGADTDRGYFSVLSLADGDRLTLCSGKIGLKGAFNPTLTYYYQFSKSDKFSIVAIATVNGTEDVPLDTLDFSSLKYNRSGWYQHRVSMDKVKGAKFVNLKFIMSNNTGSVASTGLDNINIVDQLEYDLSASIDAAPTAIRGREFPVTVKIHNLGTRTSSRYNVILRNGSTPIDTLQGVPIAIDGEQKVKFNVIAPVYGEDAMNLSAEIDYLYDLNLDNNTTATAIVKLKNPLSPRVTDLAASTSGGATNLSWSKPQQGREKVEESFENYDDFIIDNIGDWKVYDGDSAIITGFQAIDFPHSQDHFAWIVFNPTATTPSIDLNTAREFTPYEGNKYLAAFCATPRYAKAGHNDDWLISPRLDGHAQTISFRVKTMLPSEGLETYEVLYSTTTDEPSAFKRTGSERQAPANWNGVRVRLPETARYFAIRCTSENKFIMGLDDISYELGELEVLGYNIYRNGQFVGHASADATSFSITGDDAADYTITVVYNNGESAPSNIASVVSTGLKAISTSNGFNAAGTKGAILIEGAAGRTVRIFTSGGALVTSLNGKDHMQVVLSSGQYIVSTNLGESRNVVVR